MIKGVERSNGVGKGREEKKIRLREKQRESEERGE